ncbi:hypothetical protein D5F01_LYC08131 [Larimichthys crocea]|uniref:BZIP domain-containing protein n=1 Tax=Larimichthys crocea TaxID=215358 RepID=A0A6G0IND8_LARCR|nr:hypothetical protein D5F01_LYC08131 [Larimichthys crocea]
MITRRRGRTVSTTEVQSVEVDVVDAVDTDEDLPSPSEGFSADSIYAAGMELEDLFGQDYLSGLREMPPPSSSILSWPILTKNRPNQSSHRINKNAIAARMNRLKKKEYVNSLEKKVGILSTEKDELRQENQQLTKRVEELEDETRGLTQTNTTTPYPGNV